MVQLSSNSGYVTKTYDYDAFGNEKNIDEKDANPYRYCGEYFDRETGTVYLRARYYDPEIGRFTTEDSYKGEANDPLSLNLYTYCFNNPISFFDASGHIPTAMEAAQMAKQVYIVRNSEIYKTGVSGGWRLIDIEYGGDGMKIAVYSRLKKNGKPEYALVNRGTTKWIDKSGLSSDAENNVTQLLGTSRDMWASIAFTKGFVKNNGKYEITMVGHSKGGAEAIVNAVVNNRKCIVFNPAIPNLKAYAPDKKDIKNIYIFIVKGEILNKVFGEPSVGKVEYLPNENGLTAIHNHSMEAVLKGLGMKGYK